MNSRDEPPWDSAASEDVAARVPRVSGGSGDEVQVLREARGPDDALACLEIYGPYVRETAISFEERVPELDEFCERIETTSETHPWLLCEAAGTVVGYAYGAPHRTRSSYRWAADVTVYVAPSHHGRGVGRLLYTELMRRLRLQGLRAACAGITLPNAASVGLHRALGFEPVGIYRRIGWKHGAWHDVSWWQLELAPSEGAPDEPRRPGAS